MATANTMKELEQVLQRVMIRDHAGELRPLREAIYAVLRVFADAIDKNAPDHGCQLGIEQICLRSRKQSSAVYQAMVDAVSLGLLRRSKPEHGARYATHINFLHPRLIEASQKSRPYLGPKLIFDQAIKTPKTGLKSANLKEKKMVKSEKNQASQDILDVRNLDIQIPKIEPVFNTPPRPESLGLEPVVAVGLTPLPPAPSGGGVCLSPLPFFDQNQVFKDLEIFSNFLIKNEIVDIRTQVQRRRKSDHQRGGMIKNFETHPKNIDDLKFAVSRAKNKNYELTMQAAGLILIDDLDLLKVEEILATGLRVAVIETSPGNFQALLPTGSTWREDQVRSTQRALSARFGGDGNATATGQPHRLPGSVNQKNGGYFVTRLHCMQAGELIQPALWIPGSPASRPQQQHRNASGKDDTPSGRDFGRACELVSKGGTESFVIEEIRVRAAARGRHGDHDKYAVRTVANAITRLASK